MTTIERKNMITRAEKEGKFRVYTSENKDLHSKRTQEVFEMLENRELLTGKFLHKQKQEVLELTLIAFNSNPQSSIKQVIIDGLSLQNNDLPPSNMLLVTTHIVEEWERLKKEKAENKTKGTTQIITSS